MKASCNEICLINSGNAVKKAAVAKKEGFEPLTTFIGNQEMFFDHDPTANQTTTINEMWPTVHSSAW